MIGERRLPCLHTLSFQYIGVLGLCVAQVLLVDPSVIVERLGEAHADFGARRAAGPDGSPACKVASGIEHIAALGRLCDQLRDYLLDYSDGFHPLRDHLSHGIVGVVRPRPLLVHESGRHARLVDVGVLEAGVVGLPVEYGRVHERSRDHGTEPVGGHRLLRAVRVGDFHLDAESRSPEPAGGDGHHEGVRALDEIVRYIIGAIVHVLAVVALRRVEHAVTDLLPVDVELVESESGDVGPRLRDFLVGSLGALEIEDPSGHAGDIAYPARQPVGAVQQSGLVVCGLGPGRFDAVPVPYLHFPVVPCPALERDFGEFHRCGRGGSHLAAVKDIGVALREQLG